MSRKTPLVSNGYLCNLGETTAIALDTPAWFDWLQEDTHCSFHFEHTTGGFTARKEQKQRGQWYWVAYRQVHNRLYKTYLGKSETLTEVHLCATSETLAQAVDSQLEHNAARCAPVTDG